MSPTPQDTIAPDTVPRQPDDDLEVGKRRTPMLFRWRGRP